ncbi:MAG: hypothetical protein HFJ24_01970 [Clostridia bacterium]|nr:hypothetical protein [Clostridia bacterium]MCI9274815.1 hypothetical protein [Clostridia bacterium]
MSKSKNVILGSIIIVVIIIIVIIAVLLNLVRKNAHLFTDETEYGMEANLVQKVSTVQNRNNYYTVKDIVESYYYDLTQFNINIEDEFIYEPTQEEIDMVSKSLEKETMAYKQRIYNCLNNEYIRKNNITLDNIEAKLGSYNDVIVLIDNIYFMDIEETYQVYFAYGKVIEKSNSRREQFAMMITIDSQKSIFEIYPDGYGYNVEPGKELKIDKRELAYNEHNKYEYKLVSEEEYCVSVINDYKNRIIYDIQSAYNKLNQEYKQAKFGSEIDFRQYVQNNYYKLININLSSYQRKKEGDYTRYVFTDSTNSNYIFKENAPMSYDIILDTYTIELPEFTEKYDKSNDREKVILNLNKFMQSINDKDYKYAYSLLADGFKANNFKTQIDFENYLKTNFFENNNFEYKKFGDEANTYYTYEIKITDKTGKDTREITKTFIMLLEEGTNFELSFNI